MLFCIFRNRAESGKTALEEGAFLLVLSKFGIFLLKLLNKVVIDLEKLRSVALNDILQIVDFFSNRTIL